MATTALANDIMVINAHTSASLTPKAKSAAVYLTLMNHGSEADTLTAIKTDSAETAEAHQTLDENGVMKMRAVETLSVNPHETVTFEPGGLHIMLTGLKAPLIEGQHIMLVMMFEKAGEIGVDVPVVGKLGNAASTSHEHVVED